MKNIWNVFSTLCVVLCLLRASIIAGWLEIPQKVAVEQLAETPRKAKKKAKKPPLEQTGTDDPAQANLEFISHQRESKGKSLTGDASGEAKDFMKRFEPFQYRKTQELIYEDPDMAVGKFEEIWEDTIAQLTDADLWLINSSRGLLSSPQGITVLRIPLWLKALYHYAQSGREDGVIDYQASDDELAYMAAGFSVICGLEIWRRADPGTKVYIPQNPFNPEDKPTFERQPSLERLETYLKGIGIQ